jgi:hypothetical protein
MNVAIARVHLGMQDVLLRLSTAKGYAQCLDYSEIRRGTAASSSCRVVIDKWDWRIRVASLKIPYSKD